MISAVKINDKALLDYSLDKIYAEGDSNLYDHLISREIITFGQYFGDEPYWVMSIYDFTTKGDCTIDIVLNKKGLLSVDTFERIGRIAGDYVFNQNNCIRVSTHVRESNIKSLKFTQSFGFKVEGVIRKGYTKPIVEDKIIFGMLREECPWIYGDEI